MKGYLALRRIALVLAGMSALLAAYYLLLRPTTLTIAVGPDPSAQHRYVEAIARFMKEGRQPFRLRVLSVAGAIEASKALDDGRADLAVIRSDDLTARDARSIVIIHRRAVVLIARKDSGIENLRGVAGKSIGIAQADSDAFRPLLERILSQYEIEPDEVKLQELPREAIPIALASKTVEAVVLVSNPAAKPVRGLIAEMVGKHEIEFAMTGAPAHEALAFRFKELQTIELPEGVFGGKPAIPAEPVKTVAVTYEIAATARLAERTAAALTKSLMELRPRLRSVQDNSFSVETPPLDEPRGIVPHEGAAAYVNSEVKSWFDMYGEYLWLGLFTVGLVGSGIAAVMSWAGLSEDGPSDVLSIKLRGLAARLEAASTTPEIDAIQGDFDDLVLAVIRDQGLPTLAQEGQADPSPWLTTFEGLIARRRAVIAGLDQPSGG